MKKSKLKNSEVVSLVVNSIKKVNKIIENGDVQVQKIEAQSKVVFFFEENIKAKLLKQKQSGDIDSETV